MKILQIPAGDLRIPPHAAGIELTIFHLSKWLKKLGNEVIIIDRTYSRYNPKIEEIEGVRIIRLKAIRLKAKEIFKLNFFYYWHTVVNIINRFFFGLSVSAFLFRESFDIVHVHDPYVMILLVFLYPLKAKAIIYGHHSSKWPNGRSIFKKRLVNYLRIAIIKFLVNKLIAGVTVESDGTRKAFIYSGIAAHKVALTPPGRELDSLLSIADTNVVKKYHLDERRLVLYVGRIAKEKGLEFLIKAAHILIFNENMRDLLFICIGPIEQFNWSGANSKYFLELKRLISTLRLNNYFKFLGTMLLGDLCGLYKVCSLLVLPSIKEAFGSVITEAMAFGKPVVATKTYGAEAQIKDGWNGILVKPGDAIDLANKIRIVLDNRELAVSIMNNAKKSVRQLDWKNVVYKYLEFYERICKAAENKKSSSMPKLCQTDLQNVRLLLNREH